MSLIYNDNVIFYHPLDNYTEYIQNFAWSGCGGFVSGIIGSGNSAITSNALSYDDAIAYGDGHYARAQVVDKLENNKMIIVYSNASDIYAKVVTVTSSGVLLGSGTLIEDNWSAVSDCLSCVALTPSSVLIAYRDGNTGYQGYCRAFSVSGTIINNVGDRKQFAVWPDFGPPNAGLNTIRMTNSKALILAASQEGSNVNKIYGCVADVDDTTITLGTTTYSDEVSALNKWEAAGIDESTAIMCYVQASSSGFSMAVEVSGNTVSFSSGTKTSFASNLYGYDVTCVLPTPSSIVLGYKAQDYFGYSLVGTITDGIPTWGAEVKFSSEDIENTAYSHFHLSALTSNKVALTYARPNTGDSPYGGKAVVGIINGTSITWNGVSAWHDEYDATHGPRNHWSKAVDDEHVMIVYADRSAGDSGYLRISYLNLEASMEATSGNLYPSNSGCQHLAVGFWGLNPTASSLTVHVERDYAIDLVSGSISIGSGTATWNDAGITSLMTSLNDGSSHLLIMDFAYSGADSWILQTSLDGSGWIDHGLQNSGTQPIVSGITNPQLTINANTAINHWIDELVMWGGTFNQFTSTQLANLYYLGNNGYSMDQYSDLFMFCQTSGNLYICGEAWSSVSGVLYIQGSLQNTAFGNLFIAGQESGNASGDLFVQGHEIVGNSCNFVIYGHITPDLYIQGHNCESDVVNLFICGIDIIPIVSGELTRSIDWFIQTPDYYPQIIGVFNQAASSVAIQIWDITNGDNISLILQTNVCVEIGDTNRWRWSTANLPVTSAHGRHYFYVMTSNLSETFTGQFILNISEDTKWIHPNRMRDYLV